MLEHGTWLGPRGGGRAGANEVVVRQGQDVGDLPCVLERGGAKALRTCASRTWDAESSTVAPPLP